MALAPMLILSAASAQLPPEYLGDYYGYAAYQPAKDRELSPYRLRELELSQAFSDRCATRRGICQLPSPQPVGSACICDGDHGRVVN